MSVPVRDWRMLPWLVAPVAIAFAVAAASPASVGDAIRAAALTALPIAVATAMIAGATMEGSTQRVLTGLLASTLVRLLGSLAVVVALCIGLGHPAAPIVATVGGCVIVGLAIETVVRWRRLVKEPSRG
ncbi:MAG: hypothetical protein H0W72_18005 [Planctomycetes bacterium]|nr:hypothetical protein [Planctomycetota bacterium]